MANDDRRTSDHADAWGASAVGDASCFPLPPIPSRAHQKLDIGQRCAFYLAGSRAHQHLLQPLGVTAFQCGVTGRRSIPDRIRDKQDRRYASILMDPADRQSNAQCLMWGHDIFLMRITPRLLGDAPIPHGFAISDGVVAFRLKPGVTVEQVDKAVSRMLAGRSVNAYLDTADGRARMVEAGLDPRLRLHTAYTDIGRTRYSLAEEVYLLRPKREMAKLLQALAATLADLIVR